MKKLKFKVPHTFVILIILGLIMVAFTYIIPAGVYDRVTDPESGRTQILADSFHFAERTPVSIVDFPEMIYDGMVDAASIIFSIFIFGGAFEIITQTGVLSRGIQKLAKKFGNKRKLLIAIIMFVFSIGGWTFGMSIDAIVFAPMFVALMISLGYDAIVGVAVVSTGCACGFIAGILNPFNVGVAQEIVGLPLYSGAWLRIILWIVLLVVSIAYVLRYASKVYHNPEKSIVAGMDTWKDMEYEISGEDSEQAGIRDMVVGLILIVGFAALPYGVIRYGWGMGPMAALFLTMGVAGGLVHGFGPSKIADIFCEGCKNIAAGALIVGIARTLTVVMTEGNIIDTIVYGLSLSLEKLPHSLQAIGMYIAHTLINFPICSGTGQAAATMPIMGPLSEVVGMTKQMAVLCFQLGDGITNNILPTSSALMGVLSITKVPYEKWVKYVAPLIGIWMLIGVVFCVIGMAVGY
ncbi:YfcC family protein [Ihubacter sp. rT4E-8]|uniref:YfcC family protein n=1 Tax=Ihubacter sp. rT4E-8 TaxID=3242369 RepID=UPI003CE953F1